MIGPETGIIGHLRAGGSRNSDAIQSEVSLHNPTPITSFLRRRRNSTQAKLPPVKVASSLKLSYKTPSFESAGLQSPTIRSKPPMGLTSSQSKFSWINKSFLGNLRRLLDDSEEIGGVLKECVIWNTKGDAFTLRDKAVFATYLAPKYFSIMSVSTFRMVAQSWGFRVQVDPTTGGETYQHPRFVRNDPSKCEGATMQEMKESSTEPCQEESNDSKNPELKPKQEDPLLLLAAAASASTNEESSSKSTLDIKSGRRI